MIVVVTAAKTVQRARVLLRPNMSEQKFAAISARQLPDWQKRKFSHFIIKTDDGFVPAKRQIKSIIAAVSNYE
jgi:dephospho-CoA kinase